MDEEEEVGNDVDWCVSNNYYWTVHYVPTIIDNTSFSRTVLCEGFARAVISRITLIVKKCLQRSVWMCSCQLSG